MIKELLEKQGFKLLNRNIGCIEITLAKSEHTFYIKLNRNIGCIEIFYDKFKERFVKG